MKVQENILQRESSEFRVSTSENGVREFRVPHCKTGVLPDIDAIRDLEVCQLWCRFRELCQGILNVLVVAIYLQPPDAMDVAEHDLEEGLHVICRVDEMVDIEELILAGPGKETLC